MVAPTSVNGDEIDLDRARRRPLADDEVELEILHRRIEDFLDRRIEPVNLVDEQHVARLEIGEQRGKIAGLGDHRARGGAEIDAQFARDDLRQRRLAEAGRPDEQHVVERFLARARRLDEHPQIGARLFLADEFGEPLRAQRGIDVVVALVGGHQAARACSFRQFLQALPDQRRGVGAFARAARRRGDRRGRLRLAVAEIDQRRNRISTGLGARFSSSAPARCTTAGSISAKAGALSFSSVTMRSATFGPTPGERRHRRLVAHGDR